jgi:hypothetical protein
MTGAIAKTLKTCTPSDMICFGSSKQDQGDENNEITRIDGNTYHSLAVNEEDKLAFVFSSFYKFGTNIVGKVTTRWN